MKRPTATLFTALLVSSLWLLTGCGAPGTLTITQEAVAVVVDPCAAYAQATSPSEIGGAGTTDDPYVICTAAQFAGIGSDTSFYDKSFIQWSNIDLSDYSGNSFPIIGADTDNATVDHQGTAFTGSYDGDNYKISNLTYTTTDEDFVGIFGAVEDGGSTVIKDIVLENITISSTNNDYVGGLIGKVLTGGEVSISGITGVNINVTGSQQVGGLIGNFSSTAGTVTTSNISSGSVTSSFAGNSFVGGLIGRFESGAMTKVFTNVTVTGEQKVGGIIGQVDSGVSVTRCYSLGETTGDISVGGIVGEHSGSYSLCYANSKVTDTNTGNGDNVHPTVGTDTGTISDCYYNNGAGSTCSNCNNDTCSGISNSNMKLQSSYANWNFNTIWTIQEGSGTPTFK